MSMACCAWRTPARWEGCIRRSTLLPEKRSGFVFMINGEGSRARTVLNEALVKQFTAPGPRSAGRAGTSSN